MNKARFHFFSLYLLCWFNLSKNTNKIHIIKCLSDETVICLFVIEKKNKIQKEYPSKMNGKNATTMKNGEEKKRFMHRRHTQKLR